MITPLQIHAMLRRQTGEFPERTVSIDHLWNRATLAWLAAQLLRRYAHQNPGASEPSHIVRIDQALHAVEREIQWLRFCGDDAQEIDLLGAVSTALTCAEQAAMLLDADACNESNGPWLREDSLATWIRGAP